MRLVEQLKETIREFTKGVGYDTMVTKEKTMETNYTERRQNNMETLVIHITTGTRRSRERRLERARKELRRLLLKWVAEVVVGLACLLTFDKVADPVIGGVLLGIMLMTLPKSILDIDRWERRRPQLLSLIERLSSEEEEKSEISLV